jgi:hypothetical protein
MAENYYRCAARLYSPLSCDRGVVTGEGGRGGEGLRLVFSGGLAQKLGVLREIICARFGGAAYRLCPTSEDSLLGLLALALVCSGRAGTMAEAIRFLAVNVPGASHAPGT